MNLKKKKSLAARTFGVGESRIEFIEARLDEIKEAITKQDIRDLYKEGAIKIKNIKGRRSTAKKSKRKGTGNVKKKINKRKREYVLSTRKLRKHLSESSGKITDEEKKDIRKKIRNRFFRSKAHLKEYIEQQNKFATSPSSKKLSRTRGKKK